MGFMCVSARVTNGRLGSTCGGEGLHLGGEPVPQEGAAQGLQRLASAAGSSQLCLGL